MSNSPHKNTSITNFMEMWICRNENLKNDRNHHFFGCCDLDICPWTWIGNQNQCKALPLPMCLPNFTTVHPMHFQLSTLTLFIISYWEKQNFKQFGNIFWNHICFHVISYFDLVLFSWFRQYIDGSVQDCSIPSAWATEILQSCNKPPI